jgi:retron-type reverse transcriptase
MPQMSDESPSAQTAHTVKPQGPRLRVETPSAGSGDERLGTSGLMEKACERRNLLAALKRVRRNAGSPGIDGMTVEAPSDHLRAHWPRLREELLAGRYQPQPVKRVAIPKPGGGERELGIERQEGTPQGGPLSRLLANVLLDEVDKELERRGHAFVRYADDLNVYVRSQRAGERVMISLRKLFAKLKLRVNEIKSNVTRATNAEAWSSAPLCRSEPGLNPLSSRFVALRFPEKAT